MDNWYKAYAASSTYHRDYIEYQSKYLKEPRRSDVEIIRILGEIFHPYGDDLYLLDIGCSQGNLLYQIKESFPHWHLFGGDLSPIEIEECIKQPRLKGIDFKVMDIFDLPAAGYDIIIVNAVFFVFDNQESKIALESISNSLKNGGSVIIFDVLNPYPQNLQIIEENLSSASLKKIRLHIRNIEFFESQANDSGLNLKRASPFYIDIDLPSDEKSIVTHTKKFDGFRYSFRGTLFQPWHHIVLQKT